MNKVLPLIVLSFYFFSTGVWAQSNIQVGTKAPAITVTDWVRNKPADTKLEDKFIVLEFWATWCGPCIAAVPHMNEIQNQVSQDDLYYLSITDEPVAKINRVLEKIDFQSMVVTDESKQTHIHFGDGKRGLEIYPMTVLIDKQGIIKWIGEPKQLSVEIMNDFVEGKLEEANLLKLKAEEAAEVKRESQAAKTVSPLTAFMNTVKNKKKVYVFQLEEMEENTGSSMRLGNKAFMLSPVTISEIFEELFDAKVEVAEELNRTKYRLIYKNTRSDEHNFERLGGEILQVLGLEQEVVTKNVSSKALHVKEASLLKPAIDTYFFLQI